MARPTDYTPELADHICARLVDGESLRAVCRDESTPNVATVMRWIGDHERFREQYAKATEERAAGMFEDMLDIADGAEKEPSAVAKARLQVDTRKWALSRMNPKKYGDKLDLNHGGSIQTQTDEQLAARIEALTGAQ